MSDMFHKIATILIAGLIAWFGISVYEMSNQLQAIETRLHYIEQQQQEDKDLKNMLNQLLEKHARIEENQKHIIVNQLEQSRKIDSNGKKLESYGVTVNDAREFMREHLKDHRKMDRMDNK